MFNVECSMSGPFNIGHSTFNIQHSSDPKGSRLVSLLGRLEDLSLTDIVQIVFLSRRTGVLEIVDDRGRHTVLFRGGLIVNASSPEYPDLLTYLVDKGLLGADNVKTLKQMEEG